MLVEQHRTRVLQSPVAHKRPVDNFNKVCILGDILPHHTCLPIHRASCQQQTTTVDVSVVIGDFKDIGVDGFKVFNGSAYFANTHETFRRILITDDGYPAGELEINATLNDMLEGLRDDFSLDPTTGIAYVAQSSNTVTNIAPIGPRPIIFNGGNSSLAVGPTSITLASDNTTAYVTTGGGGTGGKSISVYRGLVVECTL
ncbi:hypothetical protein PENSPDRAFT_691397 [Peniophora sp. CONT]|nr:hypothetical protein PENSPDRAFT_691397 [Peniophora sp. CONT]